MQNLETREFVCGRALRRATAAVDNSSARAADVLSVTNYHAMLCIRGTVSVSLSVRPSQVGVLLKRLNVK